ncbi:MAG: hypothetical protein PVJ15_02855, partial [Gammaproteobacteria bacterium]
WQQFCEGFTRQHHGWLVSMYQLDTREVARDTQSERAPLRMFPGNRPLQEVREGHQDGQGELMVTVGTGTEETSFLIEDAVALYSRRIGEAHQGLRVDSGNGMTTLIEFRTAAEPESLDGLADSER